MRILVYVVYNGTIIARAWRKTCARYFRTRGPNWDAHITDNFFSRRASGGGECKTTTKTTMDDGEKETLGVPDIHIYTCIVLVAAHKASSDVCDVCALVFI